LPKCLQEDRTTGSSAWIQEPYAEDFSCLLRLGEMDGSEKENRDQPCELLFMAMDMPQNDAHKNRKLRVGEDVVQRLVNSYSNWYAREWRQRVFVSSFLFSSVVRRHCRGARAVRLQKQSRTGPTFFNVSFWEWEKIPRL
jgi:hypothetical protein